MRKEIVCRGQEYGRLKIIEEDEPYISPSGRKDRKFKCICECGNIVSVRLCYLKQKTTQSCGCLANEVLLAHITKHGLRYHPLNLVWKDMIQRCYNSKRKYYKYYGGKGISVCEEWKSDFKQFYDWSIKNGYQKGLSIDRIESNKDYCPENCRWVTDIEQVRNRTITKMITYEGKTKPLAEWCELLNLRYGTVEARLTQLNWSVEKSLETPVQKRHNRKGINNNDIK